MTDPIELLQERLNEIESIDFESKELEFLRRKYLTSVQLLHDNGFYKHKKDKRRKLTDYDIKFIVDYCNYSELEYFADLFNVHKSTVEKIIIDRRTVFKEKIKKDLNLKFYKNRKHNLNFKQSLKGNCTNATFEIKRFHGNKLKI